ncbi:hypothetical protein D3C71_1882930 [compost metagenome]
MGRQAHAQAVLVALRGVAAQRVLADQSIAHVHIKMRAGLVGGQAGAIFTAQQQAHDALRLARDVLDDQGAHVRPLPGRRWE